MKYLITLVIVSTFTSCFLFGDGKGKKLFKNEKYAIYNKKIVSYYLASPDLYVLHNGKQIKINLNGKGTKPTIAQEKIDAVTIDEIGKDSIQITFTSTQVPQIEHINLRLSKAIEEALPYQ